MNAKLVTAGLVGALVLATGVASAQMHRSPQGGQAMSHDQMHQMHSQMMQGGMHGSHGGMQGGMCQHGSHGGGSHAATLPKGDQSPSSLAFAGANVKMHQGMDITFTGNADRDFVQSMIPHHQGAVDMAKTVLAFGKDPEVRKLAEAIIKAQEDEIALMTTWSQKNGGK